MENLDFENRETRKKFISSTDSGIYDGLNVEDEHVLVFIQKGKGMTVKTRKKTKSNWYECIHYDANGFQEGVSYKFIGGE